MGVRLGRDAAAHSGSSESDRRDKSRGAYLRTANASSSLGGPQNEDGNEGRSEGGPGRDFHLR